MQERGRRQIPDGPCSEREGTWQKPLQDSWESAPGAKENRKSAQGPPSGWMEKRRKEEIFISPP